MLTAYCSDCGISSRNNTLYGSDGVLKCGACVCAAAEKMRAKAPPPRPQWSLLPASIASVVDVLSWSEQHKHSGESWRTKTATHHWDKALGHAWAWLRGERKDPDTGQSPLAHAVARLLMAMDTDKDKP